MDEKTNNRELVYIEWRDAMVKLSTWSSIEDCIEWADSSEGLVKEIGWIINETDSYLLLASRTGEINQDEPDLGGVFKIPKGCIVKRSGLKITSSSS